MKAEIARVTAERDDYAATVDDYKVWQRKALTLEKCNRILEALGVGKQSAQYKRVKELLEQWMP